MTYKLFIDDERFPADYDDEWVIARNFEDAVWYVEARGKPRFISFDHDLGMLGSGKTGYDFAKWFVEYCLDNYTANDILPDFGFAVHSMNPVGARNICLYMEDFVDMMENMLE